MTVAVVIPTHGPTTYLAEALASVSEADEVIVVEDGTAQADEAALGGARLLRLPRVGRSRARNAGVEAASAPFVAFLDADDVSLPGRLARQKAALEAAPDAPLSFGRVRVVDGSLTPVPDWNELLAGRFARLTRGPVDVEAILGSRCPIYTSATMVRRTAFLDSGGYDPRFDAYEDLDLYLRLAARSQLAPVDGEPVANYRLHGQNTDSDRLFAGALGVADKHLPASRGAVRRLLLERRVDALWGLGRFGEARRGALAALAGEPLLLRDPRFLKRLAASLVPTPVLQARRRA